MTSPRKSRWLLVASILALVLAVSGSVAAGYTYLSSRAIRWGDTLIVGPRFTGETSVDGGATRVRVWWENGSPVLDAPAWKGRGTIYLTLIWGLAVYHLPPGTSGSAKTPAR